jgi:hypothetical protein
MKNPSRRFLFLLHALDLFVGRLKKGLSFAFEAFKA